LWTQEQVDKLNRGIRYYIVDCNDNARDTPTIVGEIFTRVLREIESGVLPLLPVTTFPFARAPDAFRYMAQARHTGRVVFRHPAPSRGLDEPVNAQGTYLITGGLKGLGLLTAQWLAGKGAKHLLLAGRSAPDEVGRAAIDALTESGVEVAVVRADVSTDAGVARLMACLADELPPLAGVVHCAGVLDDGVLARQTPARFVAVMGPKADGAWRLHQALAKNGHRPLFFAMYSSMSSVFGSPGQGNYVAANAFLDALAHYRDALDLPALSINWGAWKEVGMAARGNTVARAGSQGIGALAPSEGMQAFDALLRTAPVQISVAPIDWPVLLSQFTDLPRPPLLSDLLVSAQERAHVARTDGKAKSSAAELEALDPAARLLRVRALVRRELATVLALSDASIIGDEQPFTSLGLDSLTAVELRNRLQSTLGRPVSATAAFEWPTIAALAEQLESAFSDTAAKRSSEVREELSL
ncbi:MAG: SDR family NAD(P)-dependent oxidoreductase, partial [Gammaproteobacteria bacterium]